YVYASPAVYDRRIFIGSYDDVFYALDAATGNVNWTFRAAGPISGSAAVGDGLVYFAHLGRPRTPPTYAPHAAAGPKIRSLNDGGFASVVTDGSKLYVVGWGKIYAFTPRRRG